MSRLDDVPTFDSLPLSIAGHILSFTIDCTADVAKLRLINRDVCKTILPLIGAWPYFIKTSSQEEAEKHAGRFVQDILSVDGSNFDGYGMDVGDNLHRAGTTLANIFNNGYSSTIDSMLLLDSPIARLSYKANKCAETLEDRIKLTHAYCEQFQTATRQSELERLHQEAAEKGLFTPLIPEGHNQEDWFQELTTVYPMMVTMTIKNSSRWLVDPPADADADAVASTKTVFVKVLRHIKPSDNDTGAGGFFHGVGEVNTILVGRVLSECQSSNSKTVQVLTHMRACNQSVQENIWNDSSEIESVSFSSICDLHQRQPIREGVSICDSAVTEELHSDLMKNIDALARMQNETLKSEINYRPYSSKIVRDIVHPGLYPYVTGKSPLRLQLEKTTPPLISEDSEDDNSLNNDGSIKKDIWGRKYEIATFYQWLPTYFSIDENGSCTIEDYINNLAPRNHQVHDKLHKNLAQLFQQALPYLESVYSYVQMAAPLLRLDMDEVDDNDISPVIGTYSSLRSKRLQVITKIVDFELKPGQEYNGEWHIEGMSHEEIVSTVLYVLHRDEEVVGGDLMFKRAFTATEQAKIYFDSPPDRSCNLDKVIKTGLVPLGTVDTLPGRLIVFPNSHVHKVDKMINRVVSKVASDATEDNVEGPAGKLRIVVFSVVNPNRRVVSTREVAPQQIDAGGSMSHEDALKHRLELMKERKCTKQDWNVKQFE